MSGDSDRLEEWHKRVGKHPLDYDSRRSLGALMSFNGMVEAEARMVGEEGEGLEGVNGLRRGR